ncbi:hypothetical protein L596_010917 [Steinernema carpocapsae]|uniref:TM2 domain-containing protein n=1 Tax=Steinernema carpocapsae TaxID=34508 RepID=A0A4U5PJS6_STECR|nr:hypothetical protein L596_010917 [Steinernema carpocapsae]
MCSRWSYLRARVYCFRHVLFKDIMIRTFLIFAGLLFLVPFTRHSTAEETGPTTTVAPKPHNNYPRENISFCAHVEDCTKFASCMQCDFPDRCYYGEVIEEMKCSTLRPCQQDNSVKLEGVVCRFCWQTDESEHSCEPIRNCSSTSTKLVRTICRVDQNVVCKGRRAFYKKIRCNHTNGYSWTTAMLLSVTLGGFGVDRFYLGLWKSAIGKLFSFGGVGVWTIIDIILIATGYVGPSDGSLYI